jgi:hypothetical protein
MGGCPPGKCVTNEIGNPWSSNLVAQGMRGDFFELVSVRVDAKANTTHRKKNGTAVESFMVLESPWLLERFSQGDESVFFYVEKLARLVQTQGSDPLDRLAYVE